MPDNINPNWELPVSFYFLVDFQDRANDHFKASFSEVSGLNIYISLPKKSKGVEGTGVWINMPGPASYGKITLKRHSTRLMEDKFTQWVNRCLRTDTDGYIKPYDVIIKLLDKDGQPLDGWSCSHCYPSSWSLDGLDSGKNGLAMETVTLTCNRINRVTM